MIVDFRSKQAEFAAYIRDPRHQLPPSDVDPQRMQIYSELFFNNIDSFLSSNFPVLRTLLNDTQWFALARDFYAQHRCQTVYFSEIAEEFLDYLQQRNQTGDYPFLLELAHYEWVEMALSIAKHEPVAAQAGFIAEVSSQALALSPLAWPLVYQYPVHLISPAFLPESPPLELTYLIVYRDAADVVRFMRSTPFTYRLLQILEQNPGLSGRACLELLTREVAETGQQQIMTEGLKILMSMAETGIVIPAVCV